MHYEELQQSNDNDVLQERKQRDDEAPSPDAVRCANGVDRHVVQDKWTAVTASFPLF